MSKLVTPFEGTYTALITPFRDNLIDYTLFNDLIERQIAGGIDGLVPVGTTGESPTLSPKEHLEVIQATVKKTAGRVPVIAGTGANSTAEAVHLTQEADRLGADAFLLVAPYYNKPSAEGLYRHFAQVAESTEKPIILYSIPGRCGIEIPVSVIRRLADAFPHVRTIKEAGGTVTRVQEIRAACGDLVTILSGDDGLTIPFIACGAKGVISVASNLAPKYISAVTRDALNGDFEGARTKMEKNYALFTDLVFIEGNPSSIKNSMHYCGVIPNADLRLPLSEMTTDNRARLETTINQLDLSDDVA